MGKIIWLASYPKSGNTWLRAFLHNYILQGNAPHSINALTDLTAAESAAPFFNKYDPRPASAFTTEDAQRLRPLVHRDLTHLRDGFVCIKTHNARLAMHGIPLITDEFTSGAIYMVRDPRDVAVSYSRYTGQSLDEIIAFMGNGAGANRSTDAQVFELLSSWSRHVESWVGSTPRLLVRYEDLLTAPAKSFARVMRFLGDQPDETRLARAISFSGFATLAAQEASEGYAARRDAAAPFFRQGRSGAWRDVLTPSQSDRIVADHGAMMKNFGYLD